MTDPQTKITSKGLLGVPRAQARTFERKRFLFYADSAADAGYLIRSGHVRCFVLDSEGRETTTAILGPGHFVGTAVVLGSDVHHLFCEALTRVEAWSLPAEELRHSCLSPSLYGWLLGSIGQRLELVLALRRGIALLSATERATDIQARLQALSGIDPNAVRQTALAGLLQIRPETLARARRPRRAVGRGAARRARWPLATGRREFGCRTVVVDGTLPDGCIGRVVSGRLELSLTADGSRTVVVEALGAGDLFSFATLLGLPAVAFSAVGMTDGAIDVLRAEQFLNQLATTTIDCNRAVVRLADRLRVMEQSLARAALPHLGDRLVHVLRQVATSDQAGGSETPQMIPTNWSHVALAKQLGVCRETVTRGLASLVKAGVVRREGRRILVLPEGAQSSRARGLKARAPHTHDETRNKCPLCGLRTAGTLCGGCAERLECELELDPAHACPNCGRHMELCHIMPCKVPAAPGPNVGPHANIVWLPIASIDEPGASQNSRAAYREASIRELSVSLRQDGFLQPLCVRRRGERFELVFGVRRFRAAVRAGLTEVPCSIRDADDNRALLLNALENLHREQLSSVARVRTIERLAATGLGVREISRRTGFNPSTISRWLRINRRPQLKQALEDDRIDIARAVILVDAPESALPALIDLASDVSATELRRRVTAIKANGTHAIARDQRQVTDALKLLRAVRNSISDADLINAIQREVDRISGRSPVPPISGGARMTRSVPTGLLSQPRSRLYSRFVTR